VRVIIAGGGTGGLAAAIALGLLGASNTATWRIERARAIARSDDRPAYSCVQQRYTYLQPILQPGQLDTITEELLDYAVAEDLALLAYSPQLGGSYARPGRPLSAAYAHAGSLERLDSTGPKRPPSPEARVAMCPGMTTVSSPSTKTGLSVSRHQSRACSAVQSLWTTRTWPR
jgi:hypothetical protein